MIEERRKSQRASVQETAYISYMGSSTRCLIANISAEGAAIEVADATYIPNRFQLMTETDRVIRNCRVVWIMRNKLGVQFETTDLPRAQAHSPAIEGHTVARMEIPTQPQRQFMQYLRAGEWVRAISLPDRPKVIAKLLSNGWIERQGIGSDMAYRITAAGLAAKTAPVQIHRK